MVSLFNGDGHEYPARIVDVARREVVLDILGIATPERELPFTLEVAAPIPKGDRAQFLIEKLTELGVTMFVPLLCRYSNTHPRDAKREKLDRWVIEASKQCGRNVLMKIDEMIDWKVYSMRGQAGELRVLAHPGSLASSALAGGASDGVGKPTLARQANRTRAGREGAGHIPIRTAVGPEGGFSEDEVTLALEHGWQAIDLGPRILRVETAAILLAGRFATEPET